MSKQVEFLTIKELSEYIRVPLNTLYKYTKEKRIPCFKVGVQLRFKKSSVDKWIAKKEKMNTKQGI